MSVGTGEGTGVRCAESSRAQEEKVRVCPHVSGGWWEGFQEEEGGPGGMCRGKSRGLRGELQGARSGEGDGGGWSEKQGQGESA